MNNKLVRLILGLAATLLVFFFVGPAELLGAISGIKIQYIGWLLFLSLLLIWVSSLKWRLFLRSAGHELPLLYLMRLYTVGYFVNLFSPAQVAGDVVRSLHVGSSVGSHGDAFISTFLERFTGLLAMAILGTVFVLLGSSATREVSSGVLVASAIVFISTLVLFSHSLTHRLVNFGTALLSRIGLGRFSAKIEQLSERGLAALALARKDPTLLVKALILSFIFHTLTVLNTYVAALAVGWNEPDLAGMFVVVPLVLLVSMVPLTPSGIGVQEGAFIYFLKRIGATSVEGLGVGIVLRAKTILLALLGGLLLVGLKRQVNAPVVEEQATNV